MRNAEQDILLAGTGRQSGGPQGRRVRRLRPPRTPPRRKQIQKLLITAAAKKDIPHQKRICETTRLQENIIKPPPFRYIYTRKAVEIFGNGGAGRADCPARGPGDPLAKGTVPLGNPGDVGDAVP